MNKSRCQKRQFLYKSLDSIQDQSLEDVNLNELTQDFEIKKVSLEAQKKLEFDITKPEIFNTLKNFRNNKSPGTDGFTAEFLKFFRVGIGEQIVKSFKYSLQSGRLSTTQTQGIISILPKRNKPREYLKSNNCRPISLLNVTYKLSSSLLAN